MSGQGCEVCDRGYMVKGCKSGEDDKNGWKIIGDEQVWTWWLRRQNLEDGEVRSEMRVSM